MASLALMDWGTWPCLGVSCAFCYGNTAPAEESCTRTWVWLCLQFTAMPRPATTLLRTGPQWAGPSGRSSRTAGILSGEEVATNDQNEGGGSEHDSVT